MFRGVAGATRTLTLDHRSIVEAVGRLSLGVQISQLRGSLQHLRCAPEGRRQLSREARHARAEVIEASGITDPAIVPGSARPSADPRTTTQILV